MNNRALLVLATMLLLAACSGNKGVKAGSTDAAAGAGETSAGAQPGAASAADGATATGIGTTGGGSDVSSGAVAAAGQIIYFDFDSSEIRSEYTAKLAEQARALTRNASLRVRLEGHTDERGSREYNIGLGERRAQAVRRALLLQGVGEAQAPTVSFGEERPAVAGSTEEAYAKNRRVELVSGN